jgi:hypothetical protein
MNIAKVLKARYRFLYNLIDVVSLAHRDCGADFPLLLWYCIFPPLAGSGISACHLHTVGSLRYRAHAAGEWAGSETTGRIISFFVAGLFLLFIGWAVPLPKIRPQPENESTEVGEDTKEQ